jgi:hypothetical protein
MRTAGPATPGPIQVLYIGGSGRSGSTLLERMLGQLPGFCAIGELVHLWERGVERNELCGCGAPFRQCDFWREVGGRAFGGWESLDVREIVSLHQAVIRHRFMPLMAAPNLWGPFEARLRAYLDIQARLYQGIWDVSGCRVIVDSSKSPPHAFLVSGIPGVEVTLLHLVRDSRGVAHSWNRHVVRPEVTEARAYMPRQSPARAAVEWMVENMLFQLLARRAVRHAIVRYETLARRPSAVIPRVVRVADVDPEDIDLTFIREAEVELRVTHSVAGNPMRFRHGRLPLHVDEEWRGQMPLRDRLLVSAITWPLLSRYRYRRW